MSQLGRRGARRLPQLSQQPSNQQVGSAGVGPPNPNAPPTFASVWLELKELFRRVWQLEASNGGGGGGGITEVDGTAPISTANPNGPTVTVSHDDSGVTPGTYGGTTFPIYDVDFKGHITNESDQLVSRYDIFYGGTGNQWNQSDNFVFVLGPGGTFGDVIEVAEGDTAQWTVVSNSLQNRSGINTEGIGGTGVPFSSVSNFATDSLTGVSKWRSELNSGLTGILQTGGVSYLHLRTQSAGFLIETDETNTTTNLGPTVGTTSGSGSYRFLGNARWSKELYVPTAGFTHTIADDTRYSISNPAGVLATGTIKLPASPTDGQVVTISSTQVITALTLNGNGNTVANGVTTLGAGPLGGVSYLFNSSDTTWYPV